MSTDDVIEVAPGPAAGGRRRRVGIAAMVVVLLAAGGIVAWAAGRGGAAGAAGGGAGLDCPATVPNPASPTFDAASPVPALPTASGVDGRLVPERAPAGLVVCEYGGASTDSGVVVSDQVPPTGVVAPDATASPAVAPEVPVPDQPVDLPLGRTTDHAGSDAAVAPLLTALQQATVSSREGYMSCLTYTDDLEPRYLVGLAFDDGVVWVASAEVCRGSTNGTASSDLDLTGPVLQVLDGVGGDEPPVPSSPQPPESGPVVSEPGGSTAPAGPGTGSGSGAPGAGDPGTGQPDPNGDVLATCTADPAIAPTVSGPLVAVTPTAVRVCRLPVSGGATATDQPADVAVALAGLLNRLPDLDPDAACAAIGGPQWALLFDDRHGTTEQVLVDAGGCRTASNGARTVRVDEAFLARLTALR